MAYERVWPTVTQNFTANGTSNGIVTVASTAGFYVKQAVNLTSSTQTTPLPLEVKRVDGTTIIHLGPIGNDMSSSSTNLSAYTVADGAKITANEQLIKFIKPDEIRNFIYERDPIKADRVVFIDKFGRYYDSVVGSDGRVRLAVDGQFTAEVDVQVDVDIDGFYDAITNPDPDNIGLIGHLRSNPTTQAEQTQRATAKRGTLDTDTVSLDISLHDYDGNKHDIANPLPVTGSFEKFFEIIGASKWMELAVYDEVVPTYSLGNTVLTLAYKEDGVTIGEAIVTFTTLTSWNIKLNRYINDDDGSQLLDDDDTPLNLD